MLRELEGYESNIAKLKSGSLSAGMIPPDTEINCSLGPNKQRKCLELNMETTNDTIIKMVVVFGDGIFEGESMVLVPDKPSKKVAVPLRLTKDLECDMNIQVLNDCDATVHTDFLCP